MSTLQATHEGKESIYWDKLKEEEANHKLPQLHPRKIIGGRWEDGGRRGRQGLQWLEAWKRVHTYLRLDTGQMSPFYCINLYGNSREKIAGILANRRPRTPVEMFSFRFQLAGGSEWKHFDRGYPIRLRSGRIGTPCRSLNHLKLLWASANFGWNYPPNKPWNWYFHGITLPL